MTAGVTSVPAASSVRCSAEPPAVRSAEDIARGLEAEAREAYIAACARRSAAAAEYRARPRGRAVGDELDAADRAMRSAGARFLSFVRMTGDLS